MICLSRCPPMRSSECPPTTPNPRNAGSCLQLRQVHSCRYPGREASLKNTMQRILQEQKTARVELMTAVAVAVVQQQCCASSSGIRVTVAVVCHLCRTLNPKPLAKAPPSPRGRVVVQVRRIGPVLPTSEAAVVIIIYHFYYYVSVILIIILLLLLFLLLSQLRLVFIFLRTQTPYY